MNKLSKKVILLSRVSTEVQTLEQQTNELILESNKLGYDDEHTIIIENKESAISLDENEREGLNKMKEHIENDKTIDCVICYEVSRLSRRPKVLFSIRDYLIEHKIQLIILKPYMRLLENDGTMSQTASIMFSLFSSLSESEMMIKKERMKRGKRQKMSENKWGGGNISFGYKVDENKNVVIDEANAEIIKHIFIEYSKGTSIRKLAIDLMETGQIHYANVETATAFIGQTLFRKQYYGDSSNIGYNYPPIISKELFDKCRVMAKLNIRRPHTKISMVYWCRNLLFNAKNNRMLTPSKANRVYAMHSLSDNLSISININFIDSFIWHIVKEYVTFHAPEDNTNAKNELKQQIEIIKMKIKTANENKLELEKQIERIEDRIIEGKMDETRGDRRIRETREKINDIIIKVDGWLNEETNKRAILSELDDNIYHLTDLNALTDEDVKKLIDKNIEKVLIWKTKTRGLYDLDVFFKTGIIKTYSFKSGSRYPKFYDEYGEQINVEIIERLKKK